MSGAGLGRSEVHATNKERHAGQWVHRWVSNMQIHATACDDLR
jgi:hypothetical protein